MFTIADQPPEWQPPPLKTVKHGGRTGEKRNSYHKRAKKDWVNRWDNEGWVERFISLRECEAYRDPLEKLKDTDMGRGTVRHAVYDTPISEGERATYPLVWNSAFAATIKTEGWEKRVRFPVQGSTGEEIPVNEAELVRKILNAYPKPFPHVGPRKILTAPRYFMPLHSSDHLNRKMELVDISRCYSQLMGKLPTILVTFDHSKQIFGRIDGYDQVHSSLYGNKHFGRALVGNLEPSQGRCFRYGKRETFPSRLYHPDTVNWVRRTLHSIAIVAVKKYGCLRWHTDGGIFEKGMGEPFIQFLNEIGLENRMEAEGKGNIYNLDNYRIGKKETAFYRSSYLRHNTYLPVADGGAQVDNLSGDTNIRWMLGTLQPGFSIDSFLTKETERVGREKLAFLSR